MRWIERRGDLISFGLLLLAPDFKAPPYCFLFWLQSGCSLVGYTALYLPLRVAAISHIIR